MKTMKFAWLACLAAASLLLAASVEAQTNFTGTVTVNQNIPDGNPVGMISQTTLSGLTGTISSMSLSLDITGGYSGDLYAYLLGPNGTTLVLLNRVGLSSTNAFGYSDTGFNITLTNGAPDLHFYQTGSYTLNGGGQLTGLWSPDGRTITPNSDGSAYDGTSALNFDLFNNIDPNGQWTLFVADLANGGGQSVLVDWSLTIVTVPEPQTWAMLVSGAGVLFALRRRRV